jgi:hypothetical protein
MAVPQPYTVPNEFVDNTTITSDSHNENWDYLETYVEALSDGSYIATDAITTLKIQDSAVIGAKIAALAVTSGKIAASVGLVTPDIGAATGTSLTTSGNVVYQIGVSADKTTDYTLAAVDNGTVVTMNSATNQTISIPLDATVPWATGTQITILRYGAGELTIAGVVGVTLQAAGAAFRLRAQYSGATLIKRTTNTWTLIGDTKV